jgi:hypothetical protein
MVYSYALGRSGEHARRDAAASYTGVLHSDGYAA